MTTGPEPYPPPPPPKQHQPRDGHHRFTSPRNQPERDAWAAARWAVDGWLLKDIAAALDVAKSAAHDAVQRGLRETRDATRATAEQARAAHRARLEAATEVAVEVMYRDHIHVSQGRVVTGTDGTPVLDDAPKLAAADRVRTLSESLRKLDGLDAPAKLELGGEVTYQIVGVDPEALS